MKEDLIKHAEEYAKGYLDCGWDEDQIASVRDAFIDGAKWCMNELLKEWGKLFGRPQQ